MYYTDISNKELQYFRNLRIKNFTIKMSDMLSSDLFKVETVKEDSIYKVYPLFYVNEITCSNPNDKVLDNKVIICQKLDNETYFSFISNPNEPIYDYAEYGSYFDVGDDLTENEFNGIVSLLRKYVKHTDNIKISQGTVKGEYGNYIFNVNGTTVTDKGILITEETISNLGTVRLEDNVFSNSKYTLHLRVYHMTDVNVSGEVSSDNIVYEDLEVELVPHMDIAIPFSQLDYDYVIGFDAKVIISHDVPVIPSREYIFQDYGLLTKKNPHWYVHDADKAELSVTVTDDGTLLSSSSTTTSRFYFANPSESQSQSPPITIDGNFVLECDVISTSFGSGSQIAFLLQGLTQNFNISGFTAPYHMKMERIGDTVKMYVDDNNWRTTTIANRTNYYMGFQIYKTASIKYANYTVRKL